ncbi:NAC domain-containing protein 2 [Quercus suber]|uniref:NAC domain-containing protein 2 n=1 Tax=Quercus suber TaxID=58331 RepID=UPI000CE1B487|nr:NAC domain-containing protein 2-like [Quercus suber]
MVRGERLAWNAIGFSDLVYIKPPWKFCTDLTAFPGDEKHYFFTELKKMKHNRVVRTVDSYGTWHESSSKKIFGRNNYINNNNGIIGFKKLLNFKVKGEGKEMKTTDWLMHEFSLPEKETNLVLCVIQKKKKKKEEMGSAYDTYHEFDPMSFLDPDSPTSAGGDPSPAPALDSEEEETQPSKKMRSDPKIDDDPFPGGDPCSAPAPAPAPAPAHDNHLELQVLDSEEEEKTRPSSDPKLDDHPVSVASSSVDLAPDFFEELTADLLEVSDLPDDESGLLDVLLDDPFGLRDDVLGLSNAVFGSPDDDFFDFQAPLFLSNS